MNAAEFRTVLFEAFKRTKPRIYPDKALLQYLQGMVEVEGGYIRHKAMNNWGNVQCSHGPPAVDGECVILTDHKADGSAFDWPYRVYSTPEDGALAMIDIIQRKWPKAIDQANAGDTLGASRALFGYYTGRGTPEQGITAHAKGVYAAAKRVALALGEKLYLRDPALRGSKNSGLWIMCAILGGIVLAGRN